MDDDDEEEDDDDEEDDESASPSKVNKSRTTSALSTRVKRKNKK